MAEARSAFAAGKRARPADFTNLAGQWTPLGPGTVTSALYGPVTGRISSLAIDPNDATGNTVWMGTTGGGLWKSTNAAGNAAAVSFVPLTDTLPVYALQGEYNQPSMSIGSVAVQPGPHGVVLAGTGDPNGASDSYYSDGILRSTDGGQTWTVATQSTDSPNASWTFFGTSTAGLAWSTTQPSVVVAAMAYSIDGIVTGLYDGTYDLVHGHPGLGLFYSTDAGVTWHMATAVDANPLYPPGANQYVQIPPADANIEHNRAATSVAWIPQRQMFVAAIMLHGYYGSTDGQNWTRLPSQPGTGLTYANCGVNIYMQGFTTCPIFRGTLAVQPATGDLYALTIDVNGNDGGIWQDLCNMGSNGRCSTSTPTFAHRVDSGELDEGPSAGSNSGVIAQGSYNLSLAALPAANNSTVLFAGTIDLYRCVLSAGATSCSLRNTTNAGNGCNATSGVAPAQHALVGLPQSTGLPLLYLGNDGGLWRSTDGVAETGSACSSSDAAHFDNLNPAIGSGGSLAEVVGFAQDPSQHDTLIAGLGELGTAATTRDATTLAWAQLSGGEGGYPLIDPASVQNWYISVGAGVDLKGCPFGTACTVSNFAGSADIGPVQTNYDAAPIDAPMLLDPQNPGLVLTGTCRVWRGPVQGGASWTSANALSPSLDGGVTPCAETNTTQSGLVRSLGAGGPLSTTGPPAHQGSQVLYAGMAGPYDGGSTVSGHVFVTQNANTASGSIAWTDVSGSPTTGGAYGFNRYAFDVSSVTVDLHDPTGGTVYATLMGFGNDTHLYKSTDFGAHWLSVNGNLLPIPTSALVIDPNDANTLYVANDAGVFATQAINTCVTQNCWSQLGTGLPDSPVTQLQAAPGLPTGDGRVGVLRAGTYGRGLWEIPLLTAHNAQQPQLSASPSSLSFLSQPVGTQSNALAVTLLSFGNSPAVISSIAVTGDFVETDTCVGSSVPVGDNCTVSVRFAPTAQGGRSGLLTIYANVPGGQVTVALSGTGTAPAAVVLTPLQVSFGPTIVNQTAAAQILTISNTGGNPSALQVPTITGDFAIGANTCGNSLPSQVGCSISITFTPTASGTRSGVLTVVDSAGTQTAQLVGIGQSPATDTLSPTSLNFPAQQTGTTSAKQQVTLTNAGDVPLTLIAAAITSGDFIVNNGCGVSLSAHSSCAMGVAFVPSATGPRAGLLQVTDQFRTQTIPLSGAGVAPPGVSLSPSTIGFGPVGVGLTSATSTVVLTNNGGMPLLLSAVAVTGDFHVAANTCGTSLLPASACSIALSFVPTQAGPASGMLTLTDNALQGTQTVSLSGTGVDFSLAADGPTSVTVSSGGIATFPMRLTSLASLSGTVNFTCTGAPANAACTVNPSPAQLGGSLLVSATLQTGITVSAQREATPAPARRGAVLCLLAFPLAGFRLRRKLGACARSKIMGLIMLGLVLPWIGGCGATRLIPISGTGSGSGTGGGAGGSAPTSPGSFPITITASCDGVTHTLAMTLIVQ